MTYEINETHDPNLRSWVESANDPNSDFPIQNLPFCLFRHRSTEFGGAVGIRIGDKILDVSQTFKFADSGKLFESTRDYSNLVYAYSDERAARSLFRLDVHGRAGLRKVFQELLV